MNTPRRRGAADSQSAPSVPHWAEIRTAVEAALAMPVETRPDFLDRACGGDAVLRARVDALLSACERVTDPDIAFLAEPASAFAARLFSDDASHATLRADPATESRTLEPLRSALAGHYEIERELGRGGTATVYLARDVRHGRPVAIKVLDASVGAELSAERFLREIRVTAGLTHPHILPLYDSGDAAGRLYFVMPHIEGETLRERLAHSGPLSTERAVRLLRELADALAYAHGRGVVHRDIKPANILMQGDHALVADFGIARAVRRARAAPDPNPASAPGCDVSDDPSVTITAAGVSPGTPAYMAPEQASGDAVDERTDLYALGIVACEVLTGSHPFGGRPAHVYRREPAPPLRTHAPDVPPALAALVARLLATDPSDRPSGAGAVLDALAAIDAKRPGLVAGVRRTALVSLVLLLALAVAGYILARRATTQRGPPTAAASGAALNAVAVLPFMNTGSDAEDEYFSDGLTDELAHALGRLPGLRIAGRSSSYAFKARDVPAPEIGRTLGVAALVGGTVRRAGGRMRVTAQLVSTADGTVLWDSIFESRTGDVFSVQDELVRSIVAALAPALPVGADLSAMEGRGTADPQAYELYLRGHYHFLQRGADNVYRAIEYFQRAIQRDPDFARAHAGLMMAFRLLPVYQPVAMDSIMGLMEESARRAVALDSTLADAQLAMAMTLALQLRWAEALPRYRAAIALDPSSATAHLDYGFALLSTGRTDEAIEQLSRALQLDPLVKSAASAVTLGYLGARRFPEALAAARHAMTLDSTFPLAFHGLGLAQEFGGQPDSAVHTLERGVRLHPGDARLLAYLVFAYAASGRWDDAREIRDRLHRADMPLIDGTEAARADLVFGDAEPLVRVLTSPEGLRRYLLGGGFLGCNPLHDPLWTDARFLAAMRAIGVPRCPSARPFPFTPPASPTRGLAVVLRPTRPANPAATQR